MSTQNLIRDGQSRNAYIAPVERLHEGLEFTYRPMLAERIELLSEEMLKAKPDASVHILAHAMSKQLEKWSEVDDKGSSVPIDKDNVRKLPAVLLHSVHQIVTGVRASDLKPNAKPEEVDDYVKELRAAGENPGQTTLDETRKNS